LLVRLLAPAFRAKQNFRKMNKKYYNKTFLNIAVAVAIAIFFAADRILKAVALAIEGKEAISIIPGLFSFNFTKNYYISFSLPLSGPFLNIAIGLIITGLIAYIIFLLRNKKSEKMEIVLFFAILLGALSNFIDRLSFGFVVDYLELKGFSVFNLADAMITVPSLVLILKNYRQISKKS